MTIKNFNELPYNLIARNFPGWDRNEEDLDKKAFEVKEAKKPLNEKVSGTEKVPEEKMDESSSEDDSNSPSKADKKSDFEEQAVEYDILGSILRNKVRMATGRYNRFGRKEVANF